jgi:hypothetical protein
VAALMRESWLKARPTVDAATPKFSAMSLMVTTDVLMSHGKNLGHYS